MTNTRKRIILLFVALCALLMSACGAGQQAIVTSNPGEAHDTIFSVEPRLNGTLTIWLTHDDVGAYCTLDTNLKLKIQQLWDTEQYEVILSYVSINAGDAELGGALSLNPTTMCARERGGEGTIVYRIVDIRPAQE